MNYYQVFPISNNTLLIIDMKKKQIKKKNSPQINYLSANLSSMEFLVNFGDDIGRK